MLLILLDVVNMRLNRKNILIFSFLSSNFYLLLLGLLHISTSKALNCLIVYGF